MVYSTFQGCLQGSRRGNALVTFALLTFVVMGIASLVVDLGLARLTQLQMQTAVDTASLCGLQLRDNVSDGLLVYSIGVQACLVNSGYSPPPATQFAADDPAWQSWLAGARSLVQGNVAVRELIRRTQASEAAALIFDDDLDPQSGDVQQFGAGPVMAMTGGIGDPTLAASQVISINSAPSSRVFKPITSTGMPGLELNAGDAPEGDMVQGTYGLNSAFGSANPGEYGDETASYDRRDFVPASGLPQGDSFLVRMRRSADWLGLDNQDGISAAGPPLPFLFGRGSLVQMNADPSANPSGYSPRRDGLTVRGTAVASVGGSPITSTLSTRVGNVLVAGASFPAGTFGGGAKSTAIMGTTPFAITSLNWPIASGAYDVSSSGDLSLHGGSGTKVATMTSVTSLVDNLDGSSGTVHVTGTTGFPDATSSPFSILINRELMVVSAASPLVDGSCRWTVERAAWGSQAHSHTAGTPVIAAGLTRVGDAVITPNSGSPSYLKRSGSRPTALGNLAALQNESQGPVVPTNTILGYVPIYRTNSAADLVYGRVIGFGLIQWQVTNWDSANGYQIQLTMPSINSVAPENATAVLSRPIPVDLLELANAADIVASLLNNNLLLASPLSAPVLVNRYLGPNFP